VRQLTVFPRKIGKPLPIYRDPSHHGWWETNAFAASKHPLDLFLVREEV